MSTTYAEANYENSIIELFVGMGYTHVYGPDVERDFHSPLYDAVLEESLARLRMEELKAAGFTPQTVSQAWLTAERELKGVQAAFGEMYQKLVRPDVIVKLDSAPEFEPLFDNIRSLSKRYFDFRAAHAKGNLPPAGALAELKRQIQSLKTDME